MYRAAATGSSLPNPTFRSIRILLLAFGCIAGTTAGYAQRTAGAAEVPHGMDSSVNGSATISSRAGATIHVKIVGENGKPLKQQSLIRITNESTGQVVFQSTKDSETSFPNLPAANYLLEVGAAGYLGMHEQIPVKDIAFDATETVILHRDPAAVDLTLKDAGALPPKTRKEAVKGVQALELSNFLEARKHLETANHQYPTSTSINFLLGYLALQQKDPDHELGYLTTAIKLDPQNAQAQNLLGQLYYDRHDYAHAAEAEEVVIASNGDSVIARRVLANSYLQLKQYEKAREHSQWTVERGGSEGRGARLVLGQALAGLHKNDEAIKTLKEYLESEPPNATTSKVKEEVALLEKRMLTGGNIDDEIAINDPSLNAENAEASLAPGLGMPADIDARKPSVAPSVQCPANVLEMAANRSKELVDSVAQFSAIEDMVHESLTAQGIPRSRETRKFNYLVSITEPNDSSLAVQEFRDSAGGVLDMPEQINTTGLAVLAIAFHPRFRDDFEMNCEGLGEWEGQPAWLIHFRQKADRPARVRTYVVSGSNYPVSLKGRAWLSAESFQMLHLESDLVRPIPEIRLMAEHTSVSYGPVQFKKNNVALWLPKNADLYVHFAKHRFHRSENFDHFMLFATDATDKPQLPTTQTKTSSPDTHGGGPRM